MICYSQSNNFPLVVNIKTVPRIYQDDEELLRNMQDDVKWLKESVMPEFLTNLTDEQLNMVIKVCEVKKCLCSQKSVGKTFVEISFF